MKFFFNFENITNILFVIFQVPFDEAVDDDIIDRQMAMYNDKKGGRRLVCKTAAEMGLIEPIGAPVLNKLRVLESISKLYGHVGDR